MKNKQKILFVLKYTYKSFHIFFKVNWTCLLSSFDLRRFRLRFMNKAKLSSKRERKHCSKKCSYLYSYIIQFIHNPKNRDELNSKNYCAKKEKMFLQFSYWTVNISSIFIDRDITCWKHLTQLFLFLKSLKTSFKCSFDLWGHS